MIAPLPPHMLCHSWGGSAQLLGGRHRGGKYSVLPFYYTHHSVSGERACVGLGMAPMSVCGPIPPLLVRAERLSAAAPFVQRNCKGGAFSLPLLTPLISVLKPAY